MARRRVRDIYGNWVYEDIEEKDDDQGNRVDEGRRSNDDNERKKEGEENVSLDWRDWFALIIASLETILLPIVIFVVVIILLVAFFFHA